ncbi:hypothetical protein ABEB36_008511 [Hypothenemus hampei]|uniref:FAM69 protein-kinase domain-containing protein n=1 Tax=Hypothenemus hampei TaxID=57062 RepID=A0ABD1EM51_HYPHA
MGKYSSEVEHDQSSYRASRKKAHQRSRRSRSSSYSSSRRRSHSRGKPKSYHSDLKEKRRRSRSRDSYYSKSRSGAKERHRSRSRRASTSSRSSSEDDRPRNSSKKELKKDEYTSKQKNEDKYTSQQFSSSEPSKKLENIVIDLDKQTIKVPTVELQEPDNIFHYSLFSSPAARMEKTTPFDLTELDSCPCCYGTDYCSELKKVSFRYSTVKGTFNNLFSVKNTYFARNSETELVLKKLKDLKNCDELFKFGNTNDFLLNNNHKGFQTCDVETAKLLTKQFPKKNLNNLLTTFNTNAEPLLLEIFQKHFNWPVPKLYGFCGSVVVIEDCGVPLNDIRNYNWHDRAFVALQLLDAAEKFTSAHSIYRLYLTDISPDNIVINRQKLITFVDLDHAILQRNLPETTIHYSEHTTFEDYAFSIESICQSSISDHNIYAVCRLLLSPQAPWPMMKGGLLHSPPATIATKQIFELVDLCVDSINKTSRFLYSKRIRYQLSTIINEMN